MFAKAKIASAQKWSGDNKGQHIELGIAESNLFLMLAAAGLSGDLFGTRLFPIGTLYDPFIARGLDALNYACYQDARFLLVATPSGITLGPEGGAHQSINPPLIALGQPGLRHYEPAYCRRACGDDGEAFRLIDDPAGESTYLRLSTRSIRQIERTDESWRDGALAGGYWLREPGPNAEAAIVAMGAVMPEALAAWEELSDDVPGLGLLAVTSPDLLHRGWTAAQAARWKGRAQAEPRRATRCRSSPHGAGLVTIADAAPASLSWLGGVLGQRVAPLGVEKFGQTGNLADLYAAYRLDGDAITEGRCGAARCAALESSAMAGRYFDEWQVGDQASPRDHPHGHRDRQRPDHHAHPQPAAAASRLRGRGEDRVRQAAGQQLLHLQPDGRGQRPRHDARHARRQPRLRQARRSPSRFSPATPCAAKASASRVRESKSRPNAGIVTWAHRSFNQRDELVCE